MFESLEAAYQEIGSGIVADLPTGWQDAYVLFEPVSSDVGRYTAYARGQDGKCEPFDLSRQTYRAFMQLWGGSTAQSGGRWTSMTFIVHSAGTFEVEYGYDALRDEELVERTRAWMRKHGITLPVVRR